MAISPQDENIINQLAGQQLGDQNVAAAQTAEAQAGQQQMAQQAAQQQAMEQAPTAQESASAEGPKTEGDKAAEDAIRYIDVAFGDNDTRRLSDKQIRDTFNRYSNLNFKHSQEVAPMSPALEYVNKLSATLTEKGHKVSGDDMAQFLKAATDAFIHNKQMGGQKDPTPDRAGVPVNTPYRNRDSGTPKDLEEQLAKWEDENAVSLPPMYREAASNMNRLSEENRQLKGQMDEVLNMAKQMSGQAGQQLQQADETQADAMRTQVANNLAMAQQQHNLPDDDEDAFWQYAMERGFTVQDLIDPHLTHKIVGDFARDKNSPEMERLMGMAQRRQAFTGAVDVAPGGGTGTAPTTDQSFIDGLVDQEYQKRNLG